MIKPDYSIHWAAYTYSKQFSIDFEINQDHLLNNFIVEINNTSKAELKKLVEPILQQIGKLPFHAFQNIDLLTSFLQKITTIEEGDLSHVDALLGLYLKAIEQNQGKLAETTSLLMHSQMTSEAQQLQSNLNYDRQTNDEKKLMVSCQEGNIEGVERLLQSGVCINTSDPLGFTPLLIACIKENFLLVKTLLSYKTLDVNKVNVQGATPLMAAAFFGNLPICSVLLEYQPCLEAKNNVGTTAFLAACRGGSLPVIELLLENGASIDAKGNSGQTAETIAASQNHLRVVEFLKNKRILLSKKNHSNGIDTQNNLKSVTEIKREIIVKGAFTKGDIDLFKALFNKNDDKNVLFLISAITHDLFEFITFLEEQGVDLNTNFKGSPALHQYCSQGEFKMVEKLLRHKVDINRQDEEGYTALMIAVARGHIEIADHLIYKGADINLQDNKGATALTYALKKGHSGLAEYLIDFEADFMLENIEGETPLDFAVIKGLSALADKMIKNRWDFKIPQESLQLSNDNCRLFFILKKLIRIC